MEVAGLILLAALGWLWLDGLKARDAAITAARRACEGEDLQFLDDTVSFASLRLARTEAGSLALKRSYTFEYSDTGDNRRQGSVVLLGHRVLLLNIGLRLVSGAPTLH